MTTGRPIPEDRVETVHDAIVEERLDRDEQTPLRIRSLKLSGGGPALGIERTTRPAGPTRPPVMLIHGFAQNRYTWRVSQRSLSGRLAADGYDVWNLELRGHGNSRSYGSGPASGFGDYVDDFARVARAMDEPPFAIGHSLGGAVCVAGSTVAKVRGIVHLAGVYTFATRNPTLRALARLSLDARPLLKINRARMSTGLAGRALARLYSLADVAGYGFPIAGWAPGSVERDILEERVRLGFDWTSLEVWLQMSRWAHGERFAWADAFEAQSPPILVVAGNADPLLHPDDARVCYEAAGTADRTFVEFEPFETGSHWGHIDLLLGKRAPAVVWPVLLKWLAAR